MLPAQTVASNPELTVAMGLIVKTIASMAAVQGPEGSSVVIVKVTVPAVISAADGVYTGVKELVLLNMPLPEVVHVKEVALPPPTPDSNWVLPEQIVKSIPALTVAEGGIVRIIASLTAVQTPTGSSVVIVKVTTPAVMSAADAV